MARYKSLFEIEGTLKDLTFYTYRGKPVVRAKSSLNREQVMNRPEFQNSRRAMAEFGGASRVGKDLRAALGSLWKSYAEGPTVNRLNSALLKVIQAGEGPKGQRPFTLNGREHLLRSFEMNPNRRFGQRYKAPLGLHYTLLGDQLDISLGPFRPEEHLNGPAGAGQFRIRFALVMLPDYAFNAEAGKYLPEGEAMPPCLLLGTEWLPLQEAHHQFRYPVILEGEWMPGRGKSLLTFALIDFRKEEEGNWVEMPEGAGMALVDIKA